jgi:rare lipoprotein A
LALSISSRNIVNLVAALTTAVALAACNQTMPVANKSDLSVAGRQASLEDGRSRLHRRVAIRQIKHTPYKRVAQIPTTSYGIASFYSEDQQTANGEKFNPNAMTAAHPTLPFGTKLRVTNLMTGRFVTVRINDRGPFVHGRVVDVSYSAAETLGIVDQGIAKVKLDVVH